MTTRLYCLRHGEPQLKDYLLGHTDSPLSPLGFEQMKNNSEELFNKKNIKKIYSSPLKRCAEFSENASQQYGLPLNFSDNIRECDFGDWDGRSMKDLYAEQPDAVQNFWKDPWNCFPPNAESPENFSKRVIKQIEQWIAQHPDENLLLITHAGVIRTLIAWALDMPLESGAHFRRLELGYAALNLIDVYTSENDGILYPRLIYTNKLPSKN